MYHPSRNQNTLTWSTTRITVLEYCNKKYFFNYYPHALKDLNEKLRLDTLLLKNLKSLEMWMGEKTHHLLSDYLKALRKGEITDEKIQQLKDEIADEMKKEYELSKNRDFSLGYDRDQKFGLSEHFYGEDIDERLEPSIHKVWANLDAFIASEWNEKVQYYFKTAKMVFIESPRQKDFESMKLKLGNIPELRHINIMASPDFGVVFDDKKYLILDWKSGQEKMDTDGVTDQVKIYALKLILKGNHSVGDLEIE
ncbi:MAG: PD-(D/E)XK nuclease family protein [bacterium]